MFSSAGRPLRLASILTAWLLLMPSPQAQARREFKDVVFATVDGKALRLDIYLPAGVASPPLLVWVHGGAWNFGTKADVPLVFLEHGIAVASVEFRQASEARVGWSICGTP